jgi:hypothetical protein
MPNLLSLGMPPRTGRKPHRGVVDKLQTEQGSARVRSRRVKVIGCGGRASWLCRSLLAFMPGKLCGVAPLRQWSHDCAMHLGKDLVVWATRASLQAFPHQESACIAASRCGDITGRCSGTGTRGAHLQRLRPPAELRRYTKVASGNTSVDTRSNETGLRSGLASALPTDLALPLFSAQRTVGASRVGTITRCWSEPLFDALMVPARCKRQSPSSRVS